MEGISDIRIIGVDAKRPPVIRKQPYIDLFFELSHKVPKDWSEDFNSLLSKHKFPAKIDSVDGLYIETWVRKPDEVAGQLAHLQAKVTECIDAYIAKIRLKQSQRQDQSRNEVEESGEQGELNRAIAGLDFST